MPTVKTKCVRWVDSVSDFTKKRYSYEELELSPIIRVSNGYIIRETEDSIIMAFDFYPQYSEFGKILVIPKCCIIEETVNPSH